MSFKVYQVDDGRYIFTDKYRGRILTVDGFRSALLEYVDNGRDKRYDILPNIIERLQSLHQTINSLANYRFYSGSLLIVYDGLSSSSTIDLRMIDFAHSLVVTSNNTDGLTTTADLDPDLDYLFGLECLIDVFKDILNNQTFEHNEQTNQIQ
jgi:inositol-hexakisphosphate 5-kinase